MMISSTALMDSTSMSTTKDSFLTCKDLSHSNIRDMGKVLTYTRAWDAIFMYDIFDNETANLKWSDFEELFQGSHADVNP